MVTKSILNYSVEIDLSLNKQLKKKLLIINFEFVEMSSEPIHTFKIVKVPSKRTYKKVENLKKEEMFEPKVARHCAAAEMPAVTMGIPKKKYSRECPVKAPTASDMKLPTADPVYDSEGKNIGLFMEHSSDMQVGTMIGNSCEYIFRKSRLHNEELERVLEIFRKSNSLTAISYMIKVIQADRNMKLSMHYMLLAEYARLSKPSEEAPRNLPRFKES